jgi:hypothetical protein
MTYEWLVVLVLGTAALFVAGGGNAATRLALPVRSAVGRIDVHIIHWAHAYRDTRLNVAVGGQLLVHCFIDGLWNCVLGKS